MNQNKERYKNLLRSILTGFVGGFFFLLGFMLCYTFNFIDKNLVKLIPLYEVLIANQPFLLKLIILISVVSIVSISISLIYYTFLKRFANLWISVLFGLLLYAMIFLTTIFGGQKLDILHFNLSTHITTLSLFILYAVFVGYSISFDYTETRRNPSNTSYKS